MYKLIWILNQLRMSSCANACLPVLNTKFNSWNIFRIWFYMKILRILWTLVLLLPCTVVSQALTYTLVQRLRTLTEERNENTSFAQAKYTTDFTSSNFFRLFHSWFLTIFLFFAFIFAVSLFLQSIWYILCFVFAMHTSIEINRLPGTQRHTYTHITLAFSDCWNTNVLLCCYQCVKKKHKRARNKQNIYIFFL